MPQKETQLFEDESTLIQCLPQLNNLRVAGKLTDVTIELQDKVTLHAHRVVFASRVPSLCDVLCDTPLTEQAVVLQWPKVSYEVAVPFIDYIYTGQLEVHKAHAASLIVLSQQLKMPQVESWVVSFMVSRLDSENLANNWELAQLLKNDQLISACLQHMKTTFETTVASDFFPHLPSDTVLSLLRADDLVVSSEESVLNAIGRWVSPLGELDETRLAHAEEMMREVRWHQIDADFRCQLQYNEDGFWNKDLGCLRLLGRIISWIECPSSRGERHCPFNNQCRGPLATICLISSSNVPEAALLTRYNFETNTSQQFMDVTGGSHAAFAALKGSIFVNGGCKQDGNYTNIDKFDMKERRWSECAPIPGWRRNHAAVAVVVGEEIVICVCGGGNRDNNDLSTCLLYSPQEDKWYELPHLKQARGCAAAVALPDGRVFVMGGEADGRQLSSVETCHLRGSADWQGQLKASSDFWTDAAAMLEPRKDFAAVAFKGSIFVADCLHVDIFTLPDNRRPLGQWTRLNTCYGYGSSGTLVVWQDRLVSFCIKRGSHYAVNEFIPPAGPSTPSRGKFDLWQWVNRGTADNVDTIRKALIVC